MIPPYLSALADHLWQSSLFAALVWILTLGLKRNQARVRWRLWLAASVKFLVPIAPFIAFGRQFQWASATAFVQTDVTSAIETFGRPFSGAQLTDLASSPMNPPTATALPLLLLTVWCAGCAMHLLAWWARWRRVAAIARHAAPMLSGRERDALRRFERVVGARQPTGLASSSDAVLEPAVFGVWRPVLLWPRDFSHRLADGQLDAIVAHELCHVRRQDNLAIALHMLVEAIFWFHPVVWLIERRLIDERERACDEEVVRLGSDPQMYAEGILRTCEFCAESPLPCVSGVTGSDLKKRIEAIMRRQSGLKLSAVKKLLLATVAIVTMAAPVSLGILSAPLLRAQAADTGPAFEVASVKPNKSTETRGGFNGRPGGQIVVTNYTLRNIIRNAYGLQDFQIVGGPDWLNTDRFDIVAKAATEAPTPQLLSMVQRLLAERFKLVVHTETRAVPIYALVMARSDGKPGPRLRPAAVDCAALAAARGRGAAPAPAPPGERPPCGMLTSPGRMMAGGYALPDVARNLSPFAGRLVVDKTGLTGTFDLDLEWTPDQRPAVPEGGAPPGALPTAPADGASIFTALQEQLGLKLEATRGPVEVLVIDKAEPPTPD